MLLVFTTYGKLSKVAVPQRTCVSTLLDMYILSCHLRASDLNDHLGPSHYFLDNLPPYKQTIPTYFLFIKHDMFQHGWFMSLLPTAMFGALKEPTLCASRGPRLFDPVRIPGSCILGLDRNRAQFLGL